MQHCPANPKKRWEKPVVLPHLEIEACGKIVIDASDILGFRPMEIEFHNTYTYAYNEHYFPITWQRLSEEYKFC